MVTAYLTNNLFNGLQEDLKKDQAIIVEDGIIIDLTEEKNIPNGASVIDLKDLYVIPGMFDCHVHLVWGGSQHPKKVMVEETSEMTTLRTAENAKTALLNGITTVRDVGGDYKNVFAVRDAIEQNFLRGARVIASGNPVIMTGGHVHEFGLEINGPHEARYGVREMAKRGADLIKVMASGGIYGKSEMPGNPQMTVEELSAICDEAHNAGMKVAAHAEGLKGINNALAAGVDTIEHGNLMDEGSAEFMAKNNVFFVPTISTFYHKVANRELLTGVPEYVMDKAKLIIDGSFNAIELSKKYGITIAAGTDDGATAMPHGALFYELELYVHAGLNNFEALQSATINAAKACGVEEELGSIEVGKKADFIGLKNNPLENISAVREVNTVVKEGSLEKNNFESIELIADLSFLGIKR